MGLLDDAIREHLELKRKHGAAEEDLRREEVEALGPARRDFVAQEVDLPPDARDQAAPEPQPADEPATWLEDEPEPTPEPLEHAAEAADAASGQEPLAAPDPAAPLREETPALEHELPPPPPRVPLDAPRADSPTAQPPPAPQEPPAPEEPGEPAPEEDEDEDVLEETPDFLQDTPEHDRLWFEQKPPRDFDFDA